MKNIYLSIIVLTIALECKTQDVQEDKDYTVFSVRLKPKSQTRFNYIIDNSTSEYVMFRNDHYYDTTVIVKVYLNKVTEFLHFFDLPNYKSFLVIPGDSICFDKEMNIVYSTSFSDYVSAYIDIPAYGNFLARDEFKDNPYNKGFYHLLREVETLYNSNQVKIASEPFRKNLKEVIELINLYEKYSQIYRLVDINKLSRSEILAMDSINNALINGKDVFTIQSPKFFIMMENIEQISARKQGKTIDNFWSDFTKVDEKIKTYNYYKQHLFGALINHFFNAFNGKRGSMSFQQIYNKLVQNNDKSSVKDSLIRLTGILLETKTNYAKAKEKIALFDSGKYTYVLRDEAIANHEPKNLRTLPPEVFESVTGEKYSIDSVLIDKKYRLIVVDLWASWCAPCIGEFSALKKIQSQMQGLPIKFVGISIDKTKEKNQWIETAKKYFGNKAFNQYWLSNDSTSQFKKKLQINSIPRFIVFDNNGNAISEDFFRPSDPKFKSELFNFLE